VVNGSLHRHGRADIAPFSSRADTLVYAYPNPVSRASGTAFFSRVPGGAAVSLWSEDGRRLRDLAFAADAAVWAWNLEAGEDGKGRKVRPGVYYYRVGGGALRPLYVRE
jgi:hypothetical protein